MLRGVKYDLAATSPKACIDSNNGPKRGALTPLKIYYSHKEIKCVFI